MSTDKNLDLQPELKLFKKKSKMDGSLSPEMFDNDMLENSNPSSESTEMVTWCGSPLFTLTTLLPSNYNVPPILLSPNHEVYVKLPLSRSYSPQPYPNEYTDIWDSNYVRMPNSPESYYPMKMENGTNKIVKRWLVIQDALNNKITCLQDLSRAILTYNQRYAEKWKYDGLKLLLEEEFAEEERDYFFKTLLPKIIKLALELPKIVTRPLTLLKRKCAKSITLSQKQIASLLANAFLCTFPRRNAKGSQTEYANYPDINFNRLFLHIERRSLEKLKCIIHYFKEITSRIDVNGVITFSRQYKSPDELPAFETSLLPLTRLHVNSEGLIEDAKGLLQVDFANKFIGGGVLGLGCVQEEIRFVLCPELLVSRLFTEVLDKHEALIITGVEQFSQCKGYATNFEWVGPFKDSTPYDNYNRKLCQVVALDALHFTAHPSNQYKPSYILRELQKAYVGFVPLDGSQGNNIAIATGNWGCGAFRGDPRLKGLIQMAAASVAGRDLAYFTFGDKRLRNNLSDIHQFLKDENVTVGQLVMTLCQFGMREKVGSDELLDYIYASLSHYDSDTDSEDGQSLTRKNKVVHTSAASGSKINFSQENKKIATTITDYFKPVAKSNTSLSKSASTANEKSNSKASSITEEKILKALDECDKLVKGKKNDKKTGDQIAEDKNLFGREMTDGNNDAEASRSSNNQCDLGLFHRLDSIDRTLT